MVVLDAEWYEIKGKNADVAIANLESILYKISRLELKAIKWEGFDTFNLFKRLVLAFYPDEPIEIIAGYWFGTLVYEYFNNIVLCLQKAPRETKALILSGIDIKDLCNS